MQFGQVPIQYMPEPQVNDTRAVTIAPRGAEAIAPFPGQRGGEPMEVITRPGEAVTVETETESMAAPTNWLLWGGLLLVLMMAMRRT